jgi:hypothetical protein
LILLTFFDAAASLCHDAAAQSHVLTWEIGATVIDIADPEMIFPEVRLGDPVRGFISYDLTTEPDSSDPHSVFYFHPAGFKNVGMVIENPRDGTEIEFVPDPSDFSGPEISNDREDEVAGLYDGVSVLQVVMPPAGSAGNLTVVSVDLLGPPDVLPDTNLPAALDLNDWPDATMLFVDLLGIEDVSSYILAEINSLTPFAPSIMPGDFNTDGNVDAADYVVWRKGLGTSYTPDHYNEWRANFGRIFSAGSGSSLPSAESLSSAVPEPDSAWLLIIGAPIGSWTVRRVASVVRFTN